MHYSPFMTTSWTFWSLFAINDVFCYTGARGVGTLEFVAAVLASRA
jgi:hypothetical protein